MTQTRGVERAGGPLDPKPWRTASYEAHLENRYTWREGNKSTSAAMRWAPREGYAQSMDDYESA